jgi:glycosyltransferase involved in cell wall biosynthesis
VHGCTIIARNYLSYARVLAESFLRHHPGGTFSVLILDDADHPVARNEGFEVLSPFDIGLDADEVRRMGMIYGVTEFATAVKPWLLQSLLDRGYESVAYVDPDIEFFAPIDDVFDAARAEGIVVIPHMMEPLSPRITEPVETMVMLAGVYNLGFIAIGKQAEPMLDWWCERLSRDCLIAPERARFVDQRWIDLVPGLFPTKILRDDPGVDVAYWNLQRRIFDWDGGRYRVNGRPLRFFHFSGFDPKKPWLLSKFQGPKPAVLLSDRPDLQRICLEYRDHVYDNGFAETTVLPYGWNFLPGGMPVTERIRRLYREALAVAEDPDDPQPDKEPPIPFDPARHDDFIAWLNTPDYHPVGDVIPISRYLETLWRERQDLRVAFPNPRWEDTERYLDWVVTTGRHEDAIPFELVPRLAHDLAELPPPHTRELAHGVNIAGYFKTESGVGEHGRRILDGIRSAGIPFATVTLRAMFSRHDHPFEDSGRGAPYRMNVVCVNADEILHFRHDVGPQLFEGHHTAAFWAWELAEFPDSLRPAFSTVDEVWVGSDFVRDAIAAHTEKPVITVPLPVGVPAASPGVEVPFKDDSPFRFLFVFDFLSVFERKNALGLIEAFGEAFEPGEGPTLLIKTINGSRALVDLERLRAVAAERPDIRVVDSYLPIEQREALIATADCYVSMHRAEGFGFTMAEAMAAGVPTIGTGYSGNMAFMNDENSYLVPYTLEPIPPGCGPYREGAVWAEPDVSAAAALMRHVYEHPEEARARARIAARDIAERHSAERMGKFIAERLAAVEAGETGALGLYAAIDG